MADYPPPTTNPFDTAKIFAWDVKTEVVTQMDRITAIVGDGENVLSLAIAAIAALQEFDFGAALPEYVEPTLLDTDITLDFTVAPLGDPSIFGTIDDFTVENTIDITGLPTISDVTIPKFDPTPLTINIPPTPPPINVLKPGPAPQNPGFTFPDEITITLPDNPDLITLTIPPTPVVTLPDFEPVFPVFIERDIDTQIQWVEADYEPVIIDDVLAQIRVFLAGGSGINLDVEESIFARARDREDRTVRQEEKQATEEFATKGFTSPPGMLVERIDKIREEGTLKKLGLNREAMIKVFDTEIENLRFAVQQGIQAEQLFIELFLAKMGRLFEVAKLAVEWQIQMYNLTVTVYQAQMQAVAIEAQVYEVRVRAAMVEIEIFKALIDAELAKTQMNIATIEAYKAEIEARVAMVDMYKAQVEAVGIQAGVYATEVGAYKTTIDAYSAEIGAEAKRFDAYATQMRGEGIKADILGSEARAYTAEVQGIEIGVRAEVAALEGEVSAINAEISNYEATVRGQLGRAQTQLASIQANIAGHGIDVSRKNLEIGAEESANRIELAGIDSANRTNQEKFRNHIASYSAKLESIVQEMRLRLGALESAGQLASTISAGALAAAHVGATISGSGGLSASGTDGSSFSWSQATQCSEVNSKSITFESLTEPDMGCN
jgi:hypothetical protein